jgi:MFS family permease
VLYYAPVIFGKLGLSSNSVSLLATGVVGIVMFLATIPAVMYVDRWGRKPTLIIGAVGMAICHFIIVSSLARAVYIDTQNYVYSYMSGRHHRLLPVRLGTPSGRRMGCSRNGLALRCALRILLGSLRLDRRCGDLANV